MVYRYPRAMPVGIYLNKKKKVLLTPEKSIEFQSWLKTDLMVVLDDFTPLSASRAEAEETVRRTVDWAKRSKAEYERIFREKRGRPYLFAVVQDGLGIGKPDEVVKLVKLATIHNLRFYSSLMEKLQAKMVM